MKSKIKFLLLLAFLPLTGCLEDNILDYPDGYLTADGSAAPEDEATAEETSLQTAAPRPSEEDINSMVDDLIAQHQAQNRSDRNAYGTAHTKSEKPELNYTVQDETIVLNGYDPEPYRYDDEPLEIPAEIDGLPVTAVADYGFAQAYYANRLRLPETVCTFGQYAFQDSAIENLTLTGEAVSIGEYAFANCNDLIAVQYDCGSITFAGHSFSESVLKTLTGSGTAVFGAECFSNLHHLEQITLSGDVTIKENAFSKCARLQNASFSSGSIEIGAHAFFRATLRSLEFTDCTGSIGSECFENCYRLDTLTIGEGITEIGSGSFKNCRRLESVTLPESLTAIGKNCFAGCRNLVITAPEGSFAAHYAKINNIPYQPSFEPDAEGGSDETTETDLTEIH